MASASRDLVVGCVADATRTYLDQAYRLLLSWRWFAGAWAQADFHVCVVGRVAAADRLRFEGLGATVHVVPGFTGRHPTSNKIRFFDIQPARGADRVLLLDCDTIVVQPPAALFCAEGLSAKIVDSATVSLAVFARLFAAYGAPMPAAAHNCTVTHAATIAYFNSGVIALTRAAADVVAPAWERINGELAPRFEALGGEAHYCEQASLSLAVALTATPYSTVGNELNFPAHFQYLPLDCEFANVDPTIIHYHGLVGDDNLLLPSKYPNVNRRIQDFNLRMKSHGGA